MYSERLSFEASFTHIYKFIIQYFKLFKPYNSTFSILLIKSHCWIVDKYSMKNDGSQTFKSIIVKCYAFVQKISREIWFLGRGIICPGTSLNDSAWPAVQLLNGVSFHLGQNMAALIRRHPRSDIKIWQLGRLRLGLIGGGASPETQN